ncbi:hypothetical protein FZ934_05450 [Rhizobium grahamii]|uniref:Uncharacterized protein n=1 Tax=Rhizobium grahamii TaxID=1120045 RepID=A0A5Q0C7I5_9HYPH|nr:hypothetical protein [Rhizobium grahamii]QFY59927.1 hypothetical protein FZ934_05450 [Rhizobium grahamii]
MTPMPQSRVGGILHHRLSGQQRHVAQVYQRFLGSSDEQEDFNQSARLWFRITLLFVSLTFIFFICGASLSLRR